MVNLYVEKCDIMNVRRITLSLALGLAALTAGAQSTAPRFNYGDRVAFIGDSITHGGHYHSYIWLFYMTRFPDMPIWIDNCGVGGDTSKEILARLQMDVLDRNPDYVTLTFGMNDTGYFDVFNKENSDSLAADRIAKSAQAYSKIVEALKDYDRESKVVMIGGSPYDETSRFNDAVLHGKNAAIGKIISMQKADAAENGWGFVDFNAPMLKIAEKEQKADSTYSFCPADRIHPDKDGQMVMAYLFLKAQGLAGSKVAEIGIDARRGKVKVMDNCEISRLSRVDGSVSFDYLAKALPYPCDSISEHGWGNIHSQRDALKLVPFTEEFNQEILKVSGLKAGNYLLSIDGQPLRRYSASELAAGVNMAEITDSPQYRQASAIMYLNEERLEVEKRFREYVWMEFNVFKDPAQRFADDWKSIDSVNVRAKDDWFVSASNYWYKKSYYPQIREVWKDYMEKIVARIYSINKPVVRKVRLEPVD